MSDDDLEDFFGNDELPAEPTLLDEDNGVLSDSDVLNNIIDKEKKRVEPKRKVTLNPRPKLNEATLISDKGISALKKSFCNYKPNKSDPYANLSQLMQKYEHWSHVMYPKLKFEDVVARCEALGSKRSVKVYMMRSRLGMPLTDEDFETTDKTSDEVITTEYNEPGIITTRDESDDEEMEVSVSVKPKETELSAPSDDIVDEEEAYRQFQLDQEAEEERQKRLFEEQENDFDELM